MDSTHDASANFRTPDRWNSVVVPERVAQRALTNVDKQPNGCWISRYSVSTHGYAQIGWSLPKEERRTAARNAMVLAHRAAWTAIHGQVPLGMTIDHICKERRCVNPDHLRLLPNFENARRTNGHDWPMGVCANGHPNTQLRPVSATAKAGGRRGGLGCADCYRLYHLRHNWRRRNPGAPLPDHLLLAIEKVAG
ncbi:HNH endonuclease signature motif containing protein [Leifsonia sp. F6_8S_P_1B]|uniref:HNH endonuclease signature motif containing protein n=1 Tax=Leifsonia williamsii TaxID=3035919 RepID=A0ABT8KHF1_9MICO|nr:HNH endonuclease signature motif containing protein [Leifsonia williamsii]MDN4616432.1 HNH endonuclease signature motif containing protein [Leifsonia williamsii]